MVISDKQKYGAFEEHLQGADTVVVFVHGICGSPSQFSFLLEPAREMGFSLVCLLLPGHGGSSRDFARTGKKEWENYVVQRVEELAKGYKNIYMVGHSLGGLLSMQAVLQLDCIKGLFLLCLPIHIRSGLKAIIRGVRIAFSSGNETDPILSAAVSANSVSVSSLFSYVTWLPRLLELLRLSYVIERRLGEIGTQAFVLQSGDDEYISKHSERVIDRGLQNCPHQVIGLRDSTHFYFTQGDRELIKQKFRELVDQQRA